MFTKSLGVESTWVWCLGGLTFTLFELVKDTAKYSLKERKPQQTQLLIRIGDSEEIAKAENVALENIQEKTFMKDRQMTGYEGKARHFEYIPKYLWGSCKEDVTGFIPHPFLVVGWSS